MRIGFTGTRKGMTEAQGEVVKRLLIEHCVHQFRHGDCIGADTEAHAIVCVIQSGHHSIIVHPPISPRYRAYCVAPIVHDPRSYLERNRNIVNNSDLLIATPGQKVMGEVASGGTWYTVRYARKRGKRVIIVFPDGRIEDSQA